MLHADRLACVGTDIPATYSYGLFQCLRAVVSVEDGVWLAEDSLS